MMIDLIDRMAQCFLRLGGDRKGATAVEYGLIVSLISVAMLFGVSSVGGSLSNVFNHLGTCIGSADNCTH